MKSQSVIKENQRLQKLLNPINEKYYGDFLVYVRGKSFFRDEKRLEEALLEILQDILDAQSAGNTADDYFGKQPKEIADDLLKEIPISIKSSLNIILTVLFTYILVVTIPSLASPNTLLDIGNLFIGGLYWTILAVVILQQIGKDIYTTMKAQKKYLVFSLGALLILVGIILSVIIKTGFTIPTDGIIGISMIGVIVLFCVVFFFRQSEKAAYLPFAPILLIGALIGISYRISIFKPFLMSDTGKVVVVISLVLGLISFYFLLNKGKKSIGSN